VFSLLGVFKFGDLCRRFPSELTDNERDVPRPPHLTV